MIKTLYFDESGHTGANLLDVEQPYFSVASTDFDADEARAVIAQCFPKYRGDELKFGKLFKYPSNYGPLTEFARVAGTQSNRFSCYLIDKKFATLAKVVDWFAEPVASAGGRDWYKHDYGARWANMFYYALSLPGNEGLLDEINALYDRLASQRTEDALSRMQSRYTELAESGPDTIKPFMNLVASGAHMFDRWYSLNTFADRNEIHVTCVVDLVARWRARHEEDFVIIHDQSTHFFKRRGLWERFMSVAARDGVVQVGAKSITFPLRVVSTTPGDSKLFPSLQLCDLIAGYFAKAKLPTLKEAETKAIHQMGETGLRKIGGGCILPGSEFPDGPPELTTGPDAVDQIRILLQGRSPAR